MFIAQEGAVVVTIVVVVVSPVGFYSCGHTQIIPQILTRVGREQRGAGCDVGVCEAGQGASLESLLPPAQGRWLGVLWRCHSHGME